MPQSLVIELRCIEYQDGTFDARSFQNGTQIPGARFFVRRGRFFSVFALYRRLRAAYPGVFPRVTISPRGN
mgnify:CR=1 FL=1